MKPNAGGMTDGWFFGILPDLDMRNARVRRYAMQQALWWATLVRGRRHPARHVPMVERTFWREWTARSRRCIRAVRVVGEAWVRTPPTLGFSRAAARAGMGSTRAWLASSTFRCTRRSSRSSRARPGRAAGAGAGSRRPVSAARSLVTFLDNHDTLRLAAMPGVTPARLSRGDRLFADDAGHSADTWGDELGMPGHMDDRRDFPGGFPGDPRRVHPAGRTPAEQAIYSTYRDLLRLRKATPALRRGTLTDLVAGETLYVYEREYQGERVVVALNLGKSAATVTIPVPARRVRAARAALRRGPLGQRSRWPSPRDARRIGRDRSARALRRAMITGWGLSPKRS